MRRSGAIASLSLAAAIVVVASCTGVDPVVPASDSGTGNTDSSTSDGPSGSDGGGDGGGDADAGPPKPGDLDPTFANGNLRGPSGAPFPMEIVHAIAIDKTGHVYVGGGADRCVLASPNPGSFRDFAIVKLGANGAIDTTFGTAGRGCVDLGAPSHFRDEVTAIAIDPTTGALIVAGASTDPFKNIGDDEAGPRMGVARLLASGAIDTTFNGGAPYRIDPLKGVIGTPLGIVLHTDGSFYTGGISDPSQGFDTQGAWIVRFTPAGAPDTGFNGTGFASFGSGGGAYGFATDNTNGIFAFGGGVRFSAYRFTATGTDVPPWGTGPVFADPGGESQARSAVSTTDRVFVATYANRTAGAVLAPAGVVKYKFDATLDTTFAAAASKPGVFLTDVLRWDRENQFSGLALQSDGKILLAGVFDGGATGNDIAVLRITADGKVDETFGEKGIARAKLPGADKTLAMAIDTANNRVVVLGLDQNGVPSIFRFVL